MAYATKYLFRFESTNGTTREIRVLKKDYAGPVIQRALGRAPVLKKQQNGPIHGTSLEFYAECDVNQEFVEFYTSDPKAYRVDLYSGDVLIWRGYLTPELYSEPDIAPPYDVQVVATDGVGELKLCDFEARGLVTLQAMLVYLLGHTGLDTSIYLLSSLHPGSDGAGTLLKKSINLDYLVGKTCYEALTYILDTFHATITWWKGVWIMARETNVTVEAGKVECYDMAGDAAQLENSVVILGNMYANPSWPVGNLSMKIVPAKKKVVVQAPWHPATALANALMSHDGGWTKANNAVYSADGYLLPNNDPGYGTYPTPMIYQQIAVGGLRSPMRCKITASGVMSEIGGRISSAVVGIFITFTVGSSVYHLRRNDNGYPEWRLGEPVGPSIDGSWIDYRWPLSSWDSPRIGAEEMAIENIPAFFQLNSFPAGTLSVYLVGYCVRVYTALLDVSLPMGYQDILKINNGARGDGDEVEIAIGKATAETNYYLAFLQGLLMNEGTLITSYSDDNFTASDFLAFISRDYALSVALPRLEFSGKAYLESPVLLPPLVFTKGGIDYWLQTFSWDMYADEVEVEILSLPAATLTVESEAIIESGESKVTSDESAVGGSIGLPAGDFSLDFSDDFSTQQN